MLLYIIAGLILLAAPMAAQNKQAKAVKAPSGTDIDPEALKVLKSSTDAIKNAKVFSFRARTAKDRLASDGQILTYFQESRATLARPDKLRVDITGEHHTVEFFFNPGEATLFDPKQSFYSTSPAPKTIDAMLTAMEKRGLVFPTANLLQTDPYTSLVDDLKKAYIVGIVNMFDKQFIHLAFSEDDADWQLWIEQKENPTPRRFEVVYKNDPGTPRITVDFLEWDLSANAAPDLFTFNKPEGAQKIDMLKEAGEK